MSDMRIDQVIAQMRELAARTGAPETTQSNGTQFAGLLKTTLESVNAGQQQASDLTTRFVSGATDASLPDVVVAIQKASLQFEAVTQVRNRLVAAYQEIMNMPV